MVKPQVTFTFEVRLEVIIEAIKTKLIYKVTKRIRILDDSSCLLGLSLFARTIFPAPVFLRSLIMRRKLSTNAINLEARENLCSLKGLYLLEVFATRCIELSYTSSPQRNDTETIGESHELSLH